MICRICKDFVARNERAVKYAVRHYAHYPCYLNAKGPEGFSGLSLWQLKQFPYYVVRDLGLMKAFEAAIAIKEAV